MENMKFTLDEAFDIMYEDMLEMTVTNDLAKLQESIDTSTNDMLDALSILQEDQNPAPEKGSEEKKDDANKKQAKVVSLDALNNSISQKITDKIANMLVNDMSYNRAYEDGAKAGNGIGDYKPETGYVVETNISDMKFPQNVIFFIKSFITWIKNNILNFIDKFLNVIRHLLGLKAGDSKFKEDDLKLNLNKVKAIETKYTLKYDGAYGTEKAPFSDVLNGRTTGHITPKRMPVTLMQIDASDLNEAFIPLTDDVALNEGDMPVQVLNIDISHDVLALKETLRHYFELFDEAYGSNNEKLFSIGDLQIVLEMFKRATDNIQHGGLTNFVDFKGRATIYGDYQISSEALKNNLIRTRVNTDNLKRAYSATAASINNIAKIITNKNIMAIGQMGAQYAILSSATYELMIDIITEINDRIKEASDIEKDLIKMRKSFEALTATLDKKRQMYLTFTKLAYTTEIQKQINDLYDGARYMTQTVQLRLNALATYLMELNDTRAIIKNLNAAGAPTEKKKRTFKEKLVDLFKD